MKQYQINKAYPALNKLAAMQLPVKMARDVFMLMRQLEPAYKFEIEQEKKLVEKYNGTVGKDGFVTFQDESSARSFYEEIEELHNLDLEFEIPEVKLDCHSLGGMKITPLELMSLEGFVEII